MTLSLCLAAMAMAQEEKKIKAKDVPAPVVAAAAKAFPNAKIGGWAKETEDGKVFYEAEMTEGKTKRDVLFLPDGKIDGVEEEIAVSALPAAVQSALKARYPKATISLAEKLLRGKDLQYELAIKNAPIQEESAMTSRTAPRNKLTNTDNPAMPKAA